MRIRRIQISNFRKLRGPLTLSGLGDGLTVIAGDNEDGKSTLLLALRAALFVKHKISAGVSEELLPFGSKVRPELRVDLEFGGRPYSIYKAFYQSPRAELTTPTGKLEGSAAEEELQRLLRFESPQKGNAEPKHEHQGLCGLLWLTQGESFLNQLPSSTLQRDLQSALEAEVGSVLTGEVGRKLLHIFRERYEENFTKTGQPRDELKKARERVETLTGKLGTLTAQLRDYEGKVDKLGELQARLHRYREDDTLGQEQVELVAKQEALLGIERRERVLESLRRDGELLAEKLKGEVARRNRRHEQREQLRRAIEELAKLEVEQQHRAVEWSALQEQMATLEAQSRALQKLREDKQREASALRQGVERFRIGKELAEREQRLAETVAIEDRRARLGEELLRLLVDDGKLQRLRELSRKVREREVELQAVATQIEVEQLGAGTLWIDGQSVSGQGEPLWLTERTVIELPGQLRLVVTPGRTGASKLRKQLDEHREELMRQLAELGLPDVMSAEREHAARNDRLGELRELEERQKRLCPEGLSALREEIFRLDRKQKLLGGDGESLPLEEWERRLLECETSLSGLEKQVGQASEASTSKRLTVSQLGQEQALLVGKLTQQQREVERSRERLTEESEQLADSELDAAVQARQQAVAAVQAQVAQLDAEVKSADPVGVRESVEQLRDAVAERLRRLQSTEREVQDLAIELRTLGQQALDEEVVETRAELSRAEVELAHKQRQAAAIRLLYDSLQAHDRSAREAYLEPLSRLIEPYLQAILPGCRLQIDEATMAMVGLRRGEHLEPFASLSIGTREQLAVIVRLAVADLMAQRGESVPLVLDDALVFCDDARFDRMLKLLRRGASRHQILVLTCHEREFLRAGAPVIRLADCRDAA